MSLRQAVRALAACLGDLPPELRTVLELRTGTGVRHSLSRAAVARYLHLSQARVAHLEKQALKMLITTASTRGCGRSSIALGGSALLEMASFQPLLGAPEGASGEVADARYVKQPSRKHPASKPSGTTVLPGITLPPDAGQALAIGLISAGTLILMALLFGDRLGLRDHWQRWRARMRRPSG